MSVCCMSVSGYVFCPSYFCFVYWLVSTSVICKRRAYNQETMHSNISTTNQNFQNLLPFLAPTVGLLPLFFVTHQHKAMLWGGGEAPGGWQHDEAEQRRRKLMKIECILHFPASHQSSQILFLKPWSSETQVHEDVFFLFFFRI